MTYFFQESVRDYETGMRGRISPFGAQSVAEFTRLAGGTFDGTTLSDIFWQETTVGGASHLLELGELKMSAGASANTSKLITSMRTARYLSGNSNIYIAGVRLVDTGGPGQIKRFGVFDAQNGFFVEQRDGEIRVVARKAGNDTNFVPHANFLRKDNFIHDNKYHSYAIEYGANLVAFFQDGKLFHLMRSELTLLATLMHLKIGMQVANLANSSVNHTMALRTASINREGKAAGSPIYFTINNTQVSRVLKTTPGNLRRIAITSGGGGVSPYIDIYDNAAVTGTRLFRLSTNNVAVHEYKLDFYNGLSINTSSNPGEIVLLFD